MPRTWTDTAFDLVPDWEQVPAGMARRDVVDVDVDQHDDVYVLTRQEARVIVYDRDGRYLRSWGEDLLSPRPHGLTVDPDGMVWVVDEGDQTVRRFTPEGSLLMTLGESGRSSDTGVDPGASDDVFRDFAHLVGKIEAGPPFHGPTGVAVAPGGDVYVADGYWNARIHRFSPDGELKASYGGAGSGPLQFRVPHAVCFDSRGRLLVADRENESIQVLSPDGELVETWCDVRRPAAMAIDADGFVYVAELPWLVGEHSWRFGSISEPVGAGVRVLDPDGNAVARFGDDSSAPDAATPHGLVAAHGIARDSQGAVYVAEISGSLQRLRGLEPPACPPLRKFTRAPMGSVDG